MSPRGLIALMLILFCVGCTVDPPSSDGGVTDAAPSCASDAECDDGVFCNGFERCEASGCVAGASPCGAGLTCDEASRQCQLGCTTDADGDGSIALHCGGDDCDDDDPRRYPGALEVCDPDHVDEDCDPTTVGDRDEDEDGAIDARCCNLTAFGELRCGTDCDDNAPGVHRTAPEVCDDIDNDCDGEVDEGVSYLLWPDADRDSFGEAGATPERHCGFIPGYALIGGDCDDGDPRINPGMHDVCNGVDDDCDEGIDERAAELCTAADGVAEALCTQLEGEAAPRCVITACAPQRLDCDLDPSDGCEANFCDQLAHCGACGGYGAECEGGRCLDGRCYPSGGSFIAWLAGTVVRDRDGSPIAGATVSRLRECRPGERGISGSTGAFELTWGYNPPGQLFLTEADGFAPRVDPFETAGSVRLLETAELDALLAESPVPVDRRLGVVVVDSRSSTFELVEPVSGTWRAPDVPANYYSVTLPSGLTRHVFVNARPGNARVRVTGAGDQLYFARCSNTGPSGPWNQPTHYDVFVSSAGIVHMRFGWCEWSAFGG